MRLVLTVSLLTLALAWGTYLMLGDTHSRLSWSPEQPSAVQPSSAPADELAQMVRNTDLPSPQGSFSDAMKKVISKKSGITEFVARDESHGSALDSTEPQISDAKKQ